jgi:CheY-like chemotaxis protein
MNNRATILIAEDDALDVELLQRAFKEAGITNLLRVVPDGQACVDFLEAVLKPTATAAGQRAPWLLLLDLKMPRLTGMDVLRWRRNQPLLRCLPVIVFSSSANQLDIESAYALGANAFVVKPTSARQRVELARLIKGFWLEFNQPPVVCSEGMAVAQKLRETSGFGQTVM